MSDELQIEGKEYISSKRASQESAYTQDYIGQLARAGHIDAQRIGGLWYISMASLLAYKQKADAYKPEPPKPSYSPEPDSLITFDGKDYVSASRAADISGYHQDYVGQLARAGTIMARQVGNRWYVEREGLLAHKAEKDSLLAAVQTQSVGLAQRDQQGPEYEAFAEKPQVEPMSYSSEAGDFLPNISAVQAREMYEDLDTAETEELPEQIPIHIRVIKPPQPLDPREGIEYDEEAVREPGKTIFYAKISVGTLVVVAVIMGGFSVLRYKPVSSGISAPKMPDIAVAASAASSAPGHIVDALGALFENVIVPELVYKRSSTFGHSI